MTRQEERGCKKVIINVDEIEYYRFMSLERQKGNNASKGIRRLISAELNS